jgi:hypothetical protein
MARLARRSRPAFNPVQFVDAAELLHHDSNHPVSHEKIRELVSGRSPVVWIGGSEPLNHPGTAHLVRAITGSGHFVFLETDGTLLRRRIHEFQPVPRLFLTVRFDAAAQLHASNNLRPRSSELAVEGLRAAQLSGLPAIAGLIQFAHSLDADGIVITSANGGADAAAVERKTAEARKLVGSKWWESFSRLVERVLNGARTAALSADDHGVHIEGPAHANEEGVKVA